jgi:hypothetical protein
MNLNELKAAGGIVAVAPVKKHIVWNREGAEPVEFDVHVRRLSFGTMERLVTTDADDRSRSAAYLAETILLGDGDEPLTYDDAYQLDPSLATALIKVARDVNATGDQPEKN